MEDTQPSVLAESRILITVLHLDNGMNHTNFSGTRREAPSQILVPGADPNGRVTQLSPLDVIASCTELIGNVALKGAMAMLEEQSQTQEPQEPPAGVTGAEQRSIGASMSSPTVTAQDLAPKDGA